MQFLIVTFFLFSVLSHGSENPFLRTTVEARPLKQKTDSLEVLKGELEEDIKKLLFTLTHEETSMEEKIEIIKTLSETALLSNNITEALEELVARGSECENEEKQKNCRIVDTVGLKAQAELIKQKTESVIRKEQDDWDIILNGVLIVAGAGFLFVPVVGPTLSVIVIKTGGALVAGIGVYRMGQNLEIVGTQRSVFELVKTATLRNVLAQAVFHLAQRGDVDLANKIIFSSTEGEVVDLLFTVIDNFSSYSVETQKIAVETLLVFPDELKIRRTKSIELLKDTMDREEDKDLRLSALRVLGQVGERAPEAAEYLKEKGEDTNESDIFRLIALIELGRNKAYFRSSIETLALWFEDKRYKRSPLDIQTKIPDSFVDLLLVKEQPLGDHSIVAKEFIRLGILSAELKLKFSKALLNWDHSSESRAFLRGFYTNPAKDIGLYVEKLSQEMLSEENSMAFEFLQSQISKLKNNNNTAIVLRKIESIIIELKKTYHNQTEIVGKVKNFVDSYKEILETIKN